MNFSLLHNSYGARYLIVLLFLTSTDVFSNNSDWCLSLWAKIFLEEQPLLDIFLLSLSPFQPSVFFPNFRKEHQVVTELSSHPESPLVATDFLHSSWEPHAADSPPPCSPSQSIIPQTINRSQPPNPSPWLTTSLFLTGWVWPLTLWADSSISFLWHQS